MTTLYVSITAPKSLVRLTRGGTLDKQTALKQRGQGGNLIYQYPDYVQVPPQDTTVDQWGQLGLTPEIRALVKARQGVIIDLVTDPTQVVSKGEVEIVPFDLIDHPLFPSLVAREVIPGSFAQALALAAKGGQLTGQKYRIPGVLELQEASRLLGNKLNGINHPLWTTSTTDIGMATDRVLYHQPTDRFVYTNGYTGCEAARLFVDRE
ncbi:MAG: hypothetical protein WCT39_03490 [Candidatus Margulisiibacteriota bacterium]